jgi:DNA-binding NtrC family response regulator
VNTTPGRVMVVDSEYQIRGPLRAVLARANYEVQKARTAEEANEARGASQCFDVVGTETLLDGKDGHELARRMADRWPDSKSFFFEHHEQPMRSMPIRAGPAHRSGSRSTRTKSFP